MKIENHYTDLFMVTQAQLQELVAAALAQGGDYCDLYFEHTTFFNLLLKDGVVSSGGFHTDFGVGIRGLKGEKTGYAYSENTAMADMMSAAKAASAIASGSSAASRIYAPVQDRKLDLYPMKENWREKEADAFLPFERTLGAHP